jgi:peptidoglycan/LPS O-acetylase OafA/YrhL
MPTASYVPPTPVPAQTCPCTGAVILIMSSGPAYTTASPGMVAQGLLSFQIPLLQEHTAGTLPNLPC